MSIHWTDHADNHEKWSTIFIFWFNGVTIILIPLFWVLSENLVFVSVWLLNFVPFSMAKEMNKKSGSLFFYAHQKKIKTEFLVWHKLCVNWMKWCGKSINQRPIYPVLDKWIRCRVFGILFLFFTFSSSFNFSFHTQREKKGRQIKKT